MGCFTPDDSCVRLRNVRVYSNETTVHARLHWFAGKQTPNRHFESSQVKFPLWTRIRLSFVLASRSFCGTRCGHVRTRMHRKCEHRRVRTHGMQTAKNGTALKCEEEAPANGLLFAVRRNKKVDAFTSKLLYHGPIISSSTFHLIKSDKRETCMKYERTLLAFKRKWTRTDKRVAGVAK